jgi:hypothetical protein
MLLLVDVNTDLLLALIDAKTIQAGAQFVVGVVVDTRDKVLVGADTFDNVTTWMRAPLRENLREGAVGMVLRGHIPIVYVNDQTGTLALVAMGASDEDLSPDIDA